MVTAEGIDELRAAGYALYPGALGENLTTTGLDRRDLRIGSRLRAGNAVLEISKMRIPCDTLDALNEPGLPPIQWAIFDAQVKAGDASSPRWGLAGFYTRVLEEGMVRAGDSIELVAIAV